MEMRSISKQIKASKRVKEIKGFYTHLMAYLVINSILLVIKIVGTVNYGESFMGPLWHFSTFLSWFFWGIGLSFHALKVFKKNPFFSKEWEERQLQKYIEEDQEEV